MRNLTIFLMSFLILSCFTSFRSGFKTNLYLPDVKASIVSTDNGEVVALIDQQTIDSLQVISGLDLSGLDPKKVKSNADLKEQLVNLVGSFLTMLLMMLIKLFFPSLRASLNKKKPEKNIKDFEGLTRI